jgi:hypothetical protein
MYAIPTNSHLCEKILNAQIGIIFHTTYSGSTIRDLQSSFNVDLSELNTVDSVWFDDATYLDESGHATLTEEETDFVVQHLECAEDIFNQLQESDLDAMVEHPELVNMIKMHANKNIREGQWIGPRYIDQLITFIHERIESEKQKLKTEQARDRWEQKKQQLHSFIDKERHMLEQVFTFQWHIVMAKNVLIEKLHTLNEIDTFLETADGYSVTSPEGFVAVDHLTNRAVKLVDRLEFSRANFERNRK